MKFTAIIFALFIVVMSSGFVEAQSLGRRTTLSKGKDASGREVITITYTGLEKPNLRVYEGIISATADTCFSNLNGNLQIADLTSVALYYDPVNSMYKLRWTPKPEALRGCSVILVTDGDETIDAADLAAWRSNFGASGLRDGARFLSTPVFKVVVDPTP